MFVGDGDADDRAREERIKVSCRFRPQNEFEIASNGTVSVILSEKDSSVGIRGTDQVFFFDKLFPWNAGQEEVYSYAARPIVNAVLKGFNGTIFAYGQTSSGKSYTMEGLDIDDKTYQGIIPRMAFSVFDEISKADECIEFLVKVSIVEIYNERIRDLLHLKKDNLKIHEDKTAGIYIEDLTEFYVSCEEELFEAMHAGNHNRITAATHLNEHSSRSHFIFTLCVEQKDLQTRFIRNGKLHFVDLAGSEKLSWNVSTERLDETKHINRSLSALGNVINALTDKRCTHVPYRDSTLTRMLQESLGGNSKTSLIITCSPSSLNESETLSTLRFGQRTKMITNVVRVNQELSVDQLNVSLEKKENDLLDLKRKLVEYEHLLISHSKYIPDACGTSGALHVGYREELRQQEEMLRQRVSGKSELQQRYNEAQQQLQASQEEMELLQRRLATIKSEKRRIENEEGGIIDEVEQLKLQREKLWLHVGTASAELNACTSRADPDSGHTLHRDTRDRKEMQLAAMYHKLLGENDGIKVKIDQSRFKLRRKDNQITKLEQNLQEAKQKYHMQYDKILKLSDALMDIVGQSRMSNDGVPHRGNVGHFGYENVWRGTSDSECGSDEGMAHLFMSS